MMITITTKGAKRTAASQRLTRTASIILSPALFDWLIKNRRDYFGKNDITDVIEMFDAGIMQRIAVIGDAYKMHYTP